MNFDLLSPRLVSLARSGITGLPLSESSVPSLEEQDWHDLFALAQRHDLTPLVHAGCIASEVTPPPHIAEQLRRQARASELRNDRALAQVAEIVQVFNAKGLQPILLKGAGLALRCYRTPGQRLFGDLDILVPLEARAEFSTLLEGLGYQNIDDQIPNPSSWLYYHSCFVRPRSLTVELHVRLARRTSEAQFDLPALWERSQVCEVPGGQARAFAIEDEIVYLACHAAKHRFRVALRQYADLAALLRTAPTLDWERLFARAEEMQATLSTAVYLGLADTLGFVDLPESTRARVETITQPHLQIAPLARYAVALPYSELPESLIQMLAARSPGAALRKLYRSIVFAPRQRASAKKTQTDNSSPMNAVSSSVETGRLHRWFGKSRRLMREKANIRAEVAICRLFEDRDYPEIG
jgi:hypothetical protein